MYNNQVFQFGGNVVATAIYDVASNTWSSGPTPPKNLDQADGPSALEPNGKVLAMLSPGLFQGGCQFVEYDPVANSITDTANPTDCPNDSSYVGHLMMLPTGQIMFTDFSGLVEIYTPAAGTVSGIAPTIDSVNSQINSPSTNNLFPARSSTDSPKTTPTETTTRELPITLSFAWSRLPPRTLSTTPRRTMKTRTPSLPTPRPPPNSTCRLAFPPGAIPCLW